MSGVGTFAGIWVLEGTAGFRGHYVIEVDHLGVMDSTFNPATTDYAAATRFAVYDMGGGNVALQSQHRNQWVGNVHSDEGFVAHDDPAPIQYTTNNDGTIQLLSEWAWATLDGDVPPQPDPEKFLVWLAEFAHFPLVRHVEVPSLAQIQSSKQAPGADFTNVILDGADLSGVNLTGATFTHASLHGTIFAGATLTRATFDGMDLTPCTLTGATMTGAHLSGAQLPGMKLGTAILDDANLTGANLQGTDLTEASLAGTNFSGVDLRTTKFAAQPKFSTNPNDLTDFSRATLPYAVINLNWSFLRLVGTQIEGLPVDQKGRPQLSGLKATSADLTGADLHDANLRSGGSTTDFSGATLVASNLAGADCSGATFADAILGGGPGHQAANLSRAVLFDANFTDAQLSGVNFSGAYLYGGTASVSGATMPGADLSNAYLASLDLSNVKDKNMAGAVFDGACLVNCNFTGTTVVPDNFGKGGSFVAACLQGADFSGANLAGADLVDAGVAPPCPSPGTCTFPVTITVRGSPVHLNITVNDAGTVLPASATNSATVCPDHERGPCVGAKLVSPRAPTSWPVATRRPPSAIPAWSWPTADPIGKFMAVWVLEGVDEFKGLYLLAEDPDGKTYFNPIEPDYAAATRFAVYDMGNGNFQLQSKGEKKWIKNANAGFWGEDDHVDTRMQFRENADGTLQLLSEGSWATLWGNPGPSAAMGWDDTGPEFPFTRHVELSLAQIQSSKRAAGADFTNVTLDGVDLSGVDLTGATFQGASINGTNFRGAKLAGTNFSEVDMRGAHFDSPASFASGPHDGADLSNAMVAFSAIGLDWSYLKLVGAQIDGVPMDQGGRRQLAGLQAISADLAGFDLHGAMLKSSDFSAATLTGANVAEADCSGARFVGAALGGGSASQAANLARAVLFDADFTDAQLSGVDFSGAYLYGGAASVSGATLPGADLSDAYLASLDLSNVKDKNMAGAVFDGACLVNSNFTGTTVLPDANGKGGSFVRACLQGADFSGASLDGANLVEAGIAGPGAPPLKATLTIGSRSTTIEVTVAPAGTLLPATATDAATTCPSGEDGPCTGAKLVSASAPTSWPLSQGQARA